MASLEEMSPEMLASMPPQMRAMLEQHYSPMARGYPAAYQDERSPDAEAGSVDWARISAAPFSWMSHRGTLVYCEIRGLQSEKGKRLNG